MPSADHSILSAGTDEARDRWAALSDRCAYTPGAFGDFDFVTGLAQIQDLPCDVVFASADGADRMAILLPYRRLGPYREAILPRFCPTSGVLLKAGIDWENARRSASSALGFVRRSFHRCGVHLSSEAAKFFDVDDWTSTPLYTFEFDLSGLGDDVTADWSAGTRRLFRKSRAEYDVNVRDGQTGKAVKLCAESYRRSGRPLPIDVASFAAFAAAPPGNVTTQTYIATNLTSGTEEAGLVVLHSGQSAYYWIAGSVPGAAMTVLLGVVIDKLREQGTRTFDFLGANTPSIAEFKRRFGAARVEYRRLFTSRSRLLDFAIRTRSRLS